MKSPSCVSLGVCRSADRCKCFNKLLQRTRSCDWKCLRNADTAALQKIDVSHTFKSVCHGTQPIPTLRTFRVHMREPLERIVILRLDLLDDEQYQIFSRARNLISLKKAGCIVSALGSATTNLCRSIPEIRPWSDCARGILNETMKATLMVTPPFALRDGIPVAKGLYEADTQGVLYAAPSSSMELLCIHIGAAAFAQRSYGKWRLPLPRRASQLRTQPKGKANSSNKRTPPRATHGQGTTRESIRQRWLPPHLLRRGLR